jgi:hypothetical protein
VRWAIESRSRVSIFFLGGDHLGGWCGGRSVIVYRRGFVKGMGGIILPLVKIALSGDYEKSRKFIYL